MLKATDTPPQEATSVGSPCNKKCVVDGLQPPHGSATITVDEIRFTHEALVPEHECFNICSKAWGSYINGSCGTMTGKGQPNPKE